MTQNNYRVFISGGLGVGKTALAHRFTKNLFLCDRASEIDGSDEKQIVIEGETCNLDVLDTAVYQEFSAMRYSCIISAEGFLVLYSIDSRKSFDEVSGYCEYLRDLKESDGIPIVIVGNKSDLENDRKVSQCEGIELAESLNCSFIETSAKNNLNVEQAFSGLARIINKSRSDNLNYNLDNTFSNNNHKRSRCEIL
ncbi:ras-like protein [Anaeramoeba flamelloides]|uniref:Ras-like protein n=1 Tax=Anaeramoeba flamelloides TaxID=1746091 RepID=A0AAV7YFC4_9EUKA|nr:ras-like protein [Anaeramoeba flamelloides]